MSMKVRGKRRQSAQRVQSVRPRGVIHPRVEAVGPEKFGIVAVDCAKQRSKWMLSDFYGRVLVAPQVVEHTSGGLRQALAEVAQAREAFQLSDMIVAVERTGNYHEVVRRAFRSAGYETRIIHPFATRQFRQPADPGTKTDDTDLAAIHRATVNGFGLIEHPLEGGWLQLRLLARHRRDLVRKRTAVCNQLRDWLHGSLPGYEKCFKDLWESNLALPIARQFPTAADIRSAGAEGLDSFLQSRQIRCCRRSLRKILAWAETSASSDQGANWQHRIWSELDDDRIAKTEQIQGLERDLAHCLVNTPYVLLLIIPGIHVVSASDLAGELGPIQHYANNNAITGRAGLFPSRYQSDQVDRPNGPLVRARNRRLRTAILQIADNLTKVNHYYGAQAALWKQAKVDPRLIRVRIAKRFCRLAYAMVARGDIFSHACCQPRHYLLDKLREFHHQHQTPVAQILDDMNQAIGQLPQCEYQNEATPLHEKLKRVESQRRRGPKPIAHVLMQVLARLLPNPLQSNSSEDAVLN